MTPFWRTIIGTLITAAVLAGGSGLILSKVTAAEVADLKIKTEKLSDKTESAAVAIGEIKAKVDSTNQSVERIEGKIDRALDKGRDDDR